jgi:hypothetical protein
MEIKKTNFISFQHIFIKQCTQQFNVHVPAICLLAGPGAIYMELLDNSNHVRVPASTHFRFDIHFRTSKSKYKEAPWIANTP